MGKSIPELTRLANECTCGNKHYNIPIEKIEISHNAIHALPAFLKTKSFRKVSIVVDENTYAAAGQKVQAELSKENIESIICKLTPDENNDVIADEVTLIEALLEIPNDADVVIAVGSGTIHDIVRFSSYKMGKAFISVPTAPSVDGFNSMGAPIVVKGMKQTFQMHSPIAIFADIEVLQSAPKKMVAAGFGDMLGKFTSLADWQFGHLTAEEPYCPFVATITMEALKGCIENVDIISSADAEGIEILFDALIQSGLAMLIMGHSYPASGAEHHLSHFWEMEFLRRKKPQVLHGAKVGVTSQVIAALYKGEFLEFLLNENIVNEQSFDKINLHKQEIVSIINQIPKADVLGQMIEKIGGDSTPEQLGVDEHLVAASIEGAHLIRNRYTMLRFLNENIKKKIGSL